MAPGPWSWSWSWTWTSSNRAQREEVQAAVKRAGIRIRLLCNNAAFGLWGRFEKTPAEEYERMLQLVAAAPIALCRAFLEDLTAFPSSAIINVSSPAAYQPMPFKAVYGAAKICLHHFSLALYEEWKERGVHVQTLVPGPTRSEMDVKGGAYKCRLTEKRRPPAEVVQRSLACLGRDLPVVATSKGTYRQRVFAGVFPTKVVTRTAAWMFRPIEAPPVLENLPETHRMQATHSSTRPEI